jgi:ligand-binding SRPBCC domain-containing protein
LIGRFEITTALPAPADRVWARVTTPDGVNHELGPFLRMTMPKDARDLSIATAPLGAKIGRSWVLAFGFIPFDYDDLTLVERGPDFRFVERSRLASMKTWQHERRVEATASGSSVTDTLTFEPRVLLRVIPGGLRLATAIVRTIFRHRHKRLSSYFAR